MIKKYVFLMLILLSTLSLSACSKNIKVDETFDRIAEKIELQKKLDFLEQQKNNFTMPSWAKDLNIFSPKGLALNTGDSYQTTEEIDGFNSIHFVYEGDYESSMQQAKNLAQKAGISINEEFKLAQDIMKKMGSGASDEMKKLAGDLKGVVYSNYSLTKNPEADQIISISVDEDGRLEVVVTDRKNMQNIAKEKVNLINN